MCIYIYIVHHPVVYCAPILLIFMWKEKYICSTDNPQKFNLTNPTSRSGCFTYPTTGPASNPEMCSVHCFKSIDASRAPIWPAPRVWPKKFGRFSRSWLSKIKFWIVFGGSN